MERGINGWRCLPWVVRETEITFYNMLQQTDGQSVDQLVDHVAKHSADSVEALIRLANVSQAHVVQQDPLHNKDGDLV